MALPVTMIEPSLCALLVPAIGAAPLPAAGSFATRQAAIAVPAITVRADEEYRATTFVRTKPLPENHFAVCHHVFPQATLDNGNDFVALLNQLVCVTSRGSPILEPRRVNGGVPFAFPIQYTLKMFAMIGRMTRAFGTDDVAGSADAQISTISDDR